MEVAKNGFVRQDWPETISRFLQVKIRIVETDPLEANVRKLLNLGHTMGHAIESWSLIHHSQPVLHGQAVAAGLWCESFIAFQKGLLPGEDWKWISSCIEKWFPKIVFPASMIPEIAKIALQDKKNESGKILCTLPSAVGKALINQAVSLDEINRCLAEYEKLPEKWIVPQSFE